MKRNKTLGATQSPTRSPTKKRQNSPGATKKDDSTGGNREGLSSPTSVSMLNSFIIKNADESFEAYFQQMRRRKLGGAGNTMDHTMGG